MQCKLLLRSVVLLYTLDFTVKSTDLRVATDRVHQQMRSSDDHVGRQTTLSDVCCLSLGLNATKAKTWTS